MIKKAENLLPDEVFFDLEDACAPAEKEGARARLSAALASSEFAAPRVAVRINGVATAWCYRDVIDVVIASGNRLDALIVPKVENATHIHYIDHLLTQVEAETRRTRPVELELLIESAAGIVNLREILAASSRTVAVAFGPGDYAASVGTMQIEIGGIDDPSAGHRWHWVMSEIVAHARAAGVQPIDGPVGDFRDESVFRESALQAQRIGFAGKWCIHPNQIEWANDVFSPSADEVAAARALLAEYDSAVERGLGAIAIDGRLVDEASRKMANEILSRAAAR